MNKLEKLIDDGFKVKIQSSSKFCVTIDNTTPSMSFNSDSIEDAVDLAYEFVQEQKKVVGIEVIDEIEEEIIITVPESKEIKIDEDILNRESKTTTSIRIYSDVCDKFKDFAEINHEFKSMDLISMALIEYIEKYKAKDDEDKDKDRGNDKDKEKDKDIDKDKDKEKGKEKEKGK
jgi:hypothetical protein